MCGNSTSGGFFFRSGLRENGAADSFLDTEVFSSVSLGSAA